MRERRGEGVERPANVVAAEAGPGRSLATRWLHVLTEAGGFTLEKEDDSGVVGGQDGSLRVWVLLRLPLRSLLTVSLPVLGRRDEKLAVQSH